MPLPILALAIASFCIGTTEFVIMGLLPEVAADLGVSIPSAGLLVTGYALGVVFGAPVVAVATAHMRRKPVLVALAALFVVGNFLCAVAPTYWTLMAARVVTAFGHGAFFGIGSVVAAGLVPRNKQASAIALLFAGLTLANILGVPGGTALGEAFGWRATFLAVVVLGLVSGIRAADPQVERDFERLAAVKSRRQESAAAYFSRNAASWDQIRLLHAPDGAVEAALLDIVGKRPFQAMLDLGTGTGRLLEIFAPLYRRGVGIDMSREMLSVARANLDKAGIANAQVRQGDIFSPPVERDAYDLVTIHQVLHYLDDPGRAVREAAKLLRPSGRLVIVDFAPHALEFLREEHAHLRLGFSDRQIAEWFSQAGLDLEVSRQFEPRGDAEAGLTVKLWLGRDRRLLVADPVDETQSARSRPVG